jgi:hypothetical protein
LIYLQRLTDNEIFALCKRLLSLHTSYYAYSARISDDEILEFLKVAFGKMGANEMITPREITRSFLNILDILFTDPDANFNDLIGRTPFVSEENAQEEEDEFFNLDEIQL